MACYGGDETILQINCGAVESYMNSGHLKLSAHVYVAPYNWFGGPPQGYKYDVIYKTTAHAQ